MSETLYTQVGRIEQLTTAMPNLIVPPTPMVGPAVALYPDVGAAAVGGALAQALAALKHPEFQYLKLLQELVRKTEFGNTRKTRNDDGAVSVFGRQFEFDMADGFPMLTTKKLHWKSIVEELKWFLSGSTNIAPLNKAGVRIWNEWADDKGELGPVYGAQWRGKGTSKVDQFSNLIEGLKTQPHSRRHIIDSWQVVDLKAMALPPCHCLMQFYVEDDGRLTLQLYQRSADIFLGVPFNIASYALLLHIVAKMVDRVPGRFIHTFGDVHLYSNHVQQAKEQLKRTPYKLPELTMDMKEDIFGDLNWETCVPELSNYQAHPHIKAEVSK